MKKLSDALKMELKDKKPDKKRLYGAVMESCGAESGAKMRTKVCAAACVFALLAGIIAFCFWQVGGVPKGRSFGYPGNRTEVNAGDYSGVAQAVSKLNKRTYAIYSGGGWTQEKDVILEQAPDAAPNSTQHSGTNNQVAGVNEADIVKTDGEYIYILTGDGGFVFILEVSADGKLSVVCNIKLESASFQDDNGNSYKRSATELHLWGDRLAVMYDLYGSGLKNSIIPEYSHGAQMARSETVIYDISNRIEPLKINQISQSGSIISSRAVDGYLYLASSMWVDESFKADDVYTFVPTVSKSGEQSPVAAENITVAEKAKDASYVTVSGISLESGQVTHTRSVLGGGSAMYASENSIYLADSVYEENDRSTSLIAMGYKDGQLSQPVQGWVPGSILNQFSMDEWNGSFRIVTDGGGTGNNVFVLNAGLETVGAITGISPDEQVKSVRFDGELCYFVTFRQTDPLFAVDMSLPEAPKVLSKLKIPGFSAYMQVYGENRLLGIGYEADEISGGTTGLKLSMFDTKDKTRVIELNRLVIPEYYYTSVQYDHKSVLADPEKGIVCFPSESSYLVYSYSDKAGFAKKGEISFAGGGKLSWSGRARSLYIGNVIYVCAGDKIFACSMDSMSVVYTVDLALRQ